MNFRRHRGLLTLVTLIAFGGASAAVAWYVLLVRLPEPSVASRPQLLRWLVLRDLEYESPEIQLALVDRLETEISADDLGPDGTAFLSDSQRARLEKNVEVLKNVWFRSRVDRYFASDPPRRMDYLAAQLAVVARWAQIDSRLAESRGGQPADLFQQIDAWIADTTGSERTRVIQVVEQGVLCWLATGDLRDVTMEDRRELADRIAANLDADPNPGTTIVAVGDQRRATLMTNCELVMEAWLLNRADDYEQLAEPQRDKFVDTQIEKVMRWGVLEMLADSEPNVASNANGQITGLIRFRVLVAEWVARAKPSDQPRLQQLVARVEQRMFARMFGMNGGR